MLKKECVRVGSIHLGQHDKEATGFIQGKEFHEQLSDYELLNEKFDS